MSYNLPLPPQVPGSVEKQVLAIRTYLYQMAEQLNVAMNNLSSGSESASGSASAILNQSASAGSQDAAGKKDSVELDSIRSIIIQNAKFVKAEIDRLDTTLESKYLTQSDFGDYSNDIKTRIEASASDVTMEITSMDVFTKLPDQVSAVQDYIQKTSGYIKYGIVEYDGLRPIMGIAIGQGLTINDDEEIETPDSAPYTTVYTANKLSFRQKNTEIFYIKDAKMYAAEIEITGTFTQSHWRTDTLNGWTLKWIG